VYAVIKTGGKQYRVSPGDSVEVEKLPYEVGEQIELDQVLLVGNGSGVKIGRPLVKGAKVKATVTRQATRLLSSSIGQASVIGARKGIDSTIPACTLMKSWPRDTG
jgi:hypothetical protein